MNTTDIIITLDLPNLNDKSILPIKVETRLLVNENGRKFLINKISNEMLKKPCEHFDTESKERE